MSWGHTLAEEVAAEFADLVGAGIEVESLEGDLCSVLAGDAAAAWLARHERRNAKHRMLCRGCGRDSKPPGKGRSYCGDCTEERERSEWSCVLCGSHDHPGGRGRYMYCAGCRGRAHVDPRQCLLFKEEPPRDERSAA